MTFKAKFMTNRGKITMGTLLIVALIAMGFAINGCQQQPPGPVAKPFGVETRVAWAGKVVGTPEPPDTFLTERLFPKITLKNPLDIEFAPGSNRVFVVQHEGRIVSFPNNNNAEKTDLLLDVKALPGLDKIPNYFGVEAYCLVFHPQFQKNHYCYVCYHIDFPYKRAVDYAAAYPQNKTAQRVSRFTVSPTDPPTIDPTTEKIIFAMPGGGHMVSCLKFGPDGDLYISSGDNGDPNPPDPFHIGQNVGDIRSKILRIDVDHPSGDLPYSIPADNPFVNMPGARGEVFSYGLRNPWKMSFDSKAGGLWVGDVGWELWESIYRADKGLNFGWSVMEGPNPVHPNGKRGPTPITPPQVTLPHTEAASITGGFVYHGKKLPALENQYIFGDWDTRVLWAAPVVDGGKNLKPYKIIAHTDQRIVAFGEDAEGELYIVDYQGGGIWGIAPNPDAGKTSNFPRKLSETGLFSDVARQVPNAGVLPFEIKAEQWVDGSTSQRFIAAPSTAAVFDDGDNKRQYPSNTVFARTLSLPMVVGDPSTSRKVETQLLHFDGRQWHGYSYRWNPEGTDATLVDVNGADEQISTLDPAGWPHGVRNQTWHFNSRAQCMTCHTTWTRYAIGFNELQLDREKKSDYPNSLSTDPSQTVQPEIPGPWTTADNELRTFRHLGLIPYPKFPPSPKPGEKPRPPEPPVVLVDPYSSDASVTLDDRARSYLDVNCSVCHRFGGGGNAMIDVTKPKSLSETKLVTNPILGTFNLRDPQIIFPGNPGRSVLFYRMAKSGSGHMPHLGSMVTDDRGLKLMADWITSLRDARGLSPATQATAQAIAEQSAAVKSLSACTSAGTAAPLIDKLLASTDGALRLLVAIETGAVPKQFVPLIAQCAMASPDETVRDLFSRFIPESPTAAAKVGGSPDPEKLLALTGDAERGRKIFYETAGGLCSKCHIIDGKGMDFGPDLSHIATKYKKADLLDNILHPSKTILAGYESHLVRLKSGDVKVGFKVSENETELVLKDAERKLVHIPEGDIDKQVIQPISAMPEGIIAELTPEQAADLLAFLEGRK